MLEPVNRGVRLLCSWLAGQRSQQHSWKHRKLERNPARVSGVDGGCNPAARHQQKRSALPACHRCGVNNDVNTSTKKWASSTWEEGLRKQTGQTVTPRIQYTKQLLPPSLERKQKVQTKQKHRRHHECKGRHHSFD